MTALASVVFADEAESGVVRRLMFGSRAACQIDVVCKPPRLQVSASVTRMSASNRVLRWRDRSAHDAATESPKNAQSAVAKIGSLYASESLLETTSDDQSRLWSALSEHCSEGIMICDTQQRIVFVNQAFESVTGYSARDAIGDTPRLLHSGQQDAEFYSRMWADVTSAGCWRGEICNRRKNGDLYIEWLSLAAVRNAAGVVSHYIGVFSDLTQRMRAEDRLRELVSLDGLTQLPNRALLADRLAQMITDAAANRSKVALLFLDLECFKNINDSMGYEVGDLVLQQLGARLANSMRRSDIVARLGGDEFAIAVSDIKDAPSADLIARKLLAEIERPIMLGGREFEISGSIGVCMYPDGGDSVSELLRNADTAMYRAKTQGRGSRQFYTHSMSVEARERLDLESDLRRAIRHEQFELHYQPQIDLRTGEILSVEALIRWHHPMKGIVMPGQFIPLAEERGLIAEIGDWTLSAAAEQAKAWERAGLPRFAIAVNVSSLQFHRDGFAARVAEVLQANKLSPRRIELEITEGVIMRDTAATIEILQRLHQLGVSLSIDDFGMGYSSLSYLRRFPIDEIKIDRSFVSEMTQDDSASGIVRGIIELARSLKLQVIAEGVETSEQLKRLINLKCESAQGYLISRPIAASQIARFVDEWPRRWQTLIG